MFIYIYIYIYLFCYSLLILKKGIVFILANELLRQWNEKQDGDVSDFMDNGIVSALVEDKFSMRITIKGEKNLSFQFAYHSNY